MISLSNLFYSLAGILWAIELIPQLIKTIKTKKVEDFSLFFPCICALAYLCFFVGCINEKSWVLFCAHLLPFANLVFMLILILKYRKKK